jgi:hypothetical protein
MHEKKMLEMGLSGFPPAGPTNSTVESRLQNVDLYCEKLFEENLYLEKF